MTHKSLTAQAQSMTECWHWTSDDKILHVVSAVAEEACRFQPFRDRARAGITVCLPCHAQRRRPISFFALTLSILLLLNDSACFTCSLLNPTCSSPSITSTAYPTFFSPPYTTGRL